MPVWSWYGQTVVPNLFLSNRSESLLYQLTADACRQSLLLVPLVAMNGFLLYTPHFLLIKRQKMLKMAHFSTPLALKLWNQFQRFLCTKSVSKYLSPSSSNFCSNHPTSATMQGASESDQKRKCKKRLIISYSSAISVSIVSVLVSIERAD